MVRLTIAGLKGGVGKSTTAIALAHDFALAGWRVTLVDLDPQASATLALGEVPSSDPLCEQALLVTKGTATFRLQPGGRTLANACYSDLAEFAERNAHEADLVIMDTPPFLGCPTSAGLTMADVVLVPVEPTPMALSGLADIASVLSTMKGPPDLRSILVRVHPRRLLSREVRAQLEEQYPGVLCTAQIPEDVRAAEAPGWGQPLGAYAPSSRAARAYLALVLELTAARPVPV